ALYDLEAGEAEVEVTLARAVITATKGADGKPIFKSDGITAAALAQAVGVKFFADEACTEEVAADKLDYATTYYMQAELLDSTNFELDKSVSEVVSAPYTTPAKELSGFEKFLAILKANWLWIVIAAVAVILLILIIALAARAAKKKRIREEQRLEKEERKEEERRQREEERRREEREERMARMQQQQAPMPQYIPQPMPQMMPQMMQMPQQMPQQQPQYAPQPAMGGGASSNELAELKAEISALRAEQSSAKEVAALRAEMAAKEVAALRAEQSLIMRTDLNALHDNQLIARMGGEQTVGGGITLDKLTELIRTEVNAALDGRAKAAAAPATVNDSAAPAAAQVPPDAVMTTVTTTKIDTTKKPAQTAQNAQAAAPVRTVVRNVVAPMPVDDGRIFDVGGFYKPADPVDMGLTDEEKND
ncbi:MAG: hypothetical protein K2G26_00205, partial [Clostridia bacterium]|nr:hypothetical protein [Clostridia bacterium]